MKRKPQKPIEPELVDPAISRQYTGLVLPGLIDSFRTKKNGQKKYTGKVVYLYEGKFTVIAHVYGDTLEQMRARKHLVVDALKTSRQVRQQAKQQ